MNRILSKLQPASPLRAGLGAALLATLPFAAGCATQQQLQEYEQEILLLREEKAQLQDENRRLNSDLSRYESELANAVAARDELANRPVPQFSELENAGLGVDVRNGRVAITLPNSITFASGSAELTKQGQDALRLVSNRLKSDFGSGLYWIEGHTDNDQPSRGKFKTNRELSFARAMAVLRYLVEQTGISDSQCVVAGHGEYRPLTSNTSASGKAQNRRVEIIIDQS